VKSGVAETPLAQRPNDDAPGSEFLGEREAYFGPDFGLIRTPVLTRNALLGSATAGPLIVEEYDATCVVPPDCSASVDGTGSITIERT
jgi:N-methylhydantoinase A